MAFWKESNEMRLINYGILFLLVGYIPSYALTYAISSKELVQEAKRYNGQMIYFEGEIIGEVMRRGDTAWLNISDGGFAIGVFAQTSHLPKITYYGGYKTVGDRIQVKGVFNRTCSMHGGELDIHAKSLTIVKQGHLVEHPINLSRVRIALFLSLIALILVIIHFLKTKSRTSSNI